MKNLERLLELYRNDQRVNQIVEKLTTTPPTRLQITVMLGAQDSFVLAATYLSHPQSHLLVAKDKEEAAYVQNNLQNLLGKKPVHFFPDSFKRPRAFDQLNTSNVLQRTEVINKITSSEATGQLIVTYPEALFEKVVAPAVLNKTRMSIAVNESVDVDFLIEVLVEYGFERVDFVYEPGQFSIRGGIVDIFSYGNEWPYRIELFDEDVELSLIHISEPTRPY